MDNATKALAKMNLILHDCPTARSGRTTRSRRRTSRTATNALKTFDFVVANPPFSTKAWTNGFDPANDLVRPLRARRAAAEERRLRLPAAHPRQPEEHRQGRHHPAARRAVPRRCRGEHPPRIVERGYIKGIIGLPANLFYGTGIPACIVVLDKEGAAGRKGIFMIDASKGFIKDGNKNRLRAQDIHKIVDAFTRQLELPRYSRMVPLARSRPEERLQPEPAALHRHRASPRTSRTSTATCAAASPTATSTRSSAYWKVFPGCAGGAVQEGRRPATPSSRSPPPTSRARSSATPSSRPGARRPRSCSPSGEGERATAARDQEGRQAQGAHRDAGRGAAGDVPEGQALDAYDVYQHLMDYWAETMQDDVYLIASDGWREAAKPRLMVEDKDKKSKDKPDFTIGKQKFKAELIPMALLIARYFAAEQAAIEKLESEAAPSRRRWRNCRGARRRGRAARRREERQGQAHQGVGRRPAQGDQGDKDAADERKVLGDYLALSRRSRSSSAQGQGGAGGPDRSKVAAKYGKLSEDDIKASSSMTSGWPPRGRVQGELDRVSQTLTGRVRQLAERYATPLPKLTQEDGSVWK
jgi:type I restriction enzyme M protein